MDTPLHDLIVVSDLHLGRGKNPESGRYYNLEAFFFDEDFQRFCRYLCTDSAARGVPFKLVLNGDVFDLLRIEPEQADLGTTTFMQRRLGTSPTPTTAAVMVWQILEGHPSFVDGIAHVLEHGFEVIILPGNHDVEIQWEPVRAAVRHAIIGRVQARSGAAAAEEAAPRLRFEPWFHHEPGRIWIEHGCQYDPENSFRYLLRSGLAKVPSALREADHDMPLGTFFQRYLYNGFGHMTFIVPSTRANYRYFKWLLINQPRLLANVILSNGVFFLKFLRRLSASASASRHELAAMHAEELGELAASSGLGDPLVQIDGFKKVRGDLKHAARDVGRGLLKLVAASALVPLFTVMLWFAGFQLIQELRLGFGFAAPLLLILTLVLLFALVMGLGYLLRSPPAVSTRPMEDAAQKISSLLDVPLVTFGHSHDEVILRLRRRSPKGEAPRASWYYNTGTWIAVFTHDVLLPRERVQFTFLRVRGIVGELMHWSPGRGEPQGVILLHEDVFDQPPVKPEARPA